MFFEKGVRVMAFGEVHEFDGETLCGELFEGFIGGGEACFVTIVTEDDLVGVALDHASVVLCEGSAEGSDGVFEPRFVEADGIDLSFADESCFLAAHGATCFVEGEEEFGFIEKRGIAGVDVFSSFVVSAKNASAEADDITMVVVNGEGELVPEFYPESGTGVFFLFESTEPGLEDFASGESFLASEV